MLDALFAAGVAQALAGDVPAYDPRDSLEPTIVLADGSSIGFMFRPYNAFAVSGSACGFVGSTWACALGWSHGGGRGVTLAAFGWSGVILQCCAGLSASIG
jgi:hypothetical protein